MAGQEDNSRIQKSRLDRGSYRGKLLYPGKGRNRDYFGVPVHGTKPIKVGLLKGLIKDAGRTI